jgi:hypothetical protein
LAEGELQRFFSLHFPEFFRAPEYQRLPSLIFPPGSENNQGKYRRHSSNNFLRKQVVTGFQQALRASLSGRVKICFSS